MLRLDRGGVGEVCDRPCDPEQTVRPATGQLFALGEDDGARPDRRRKGAGLPEGAAADPGIEEAAVSADLPRPTGRDPSRDEVRALGF